MTVKKYPKMSPKLAPVMTTGMMKVKTQANDTSAAKPRYANIDFTCSWSRQKMKLKEEKLFIHLAAWEISLV